MATPDEHTVIRAANSPRPLTVKIELDNGVTFSVDQDKLPIIVGRSQDCDIQIPQSDISRQHCELFLKNNLLFIKDSSTNGTFVGSKRIRGESIAIEAPTKVILSQDAIMMVYPSDPANVIRGTRFDQNRREDDRRQFERRSNVTVVDFERRSNDTRRVAQRRVVASA